jgi:chorismate-pyruvate lyase
MQVSKMLKVMVSLVYLFALTACATMTTSKNAASLPPQTLEDLINNKGSMTKALESLHHNLSVELLKNGIVANEYVRISSLKLESTPVIAAIVSTNVANPTFVSILRNAATTPIGKMLFAPGSDIHRRNDMKVVVLTVHEVDNDIVHQYLNSLGYNDATHLVARKSEFYHQTETLEITEYILPSMTKYFNK